MKKIGKGEVRSCSFLSEAYERASKAAFESRPPRPLGLRFDGERYGNMVSPVASLSGQSGCEGFGCEKVVRVTHNLPRIDVTNAQGGTADLYSTLEGTETVEVSPHPCGQERM